MGFLQNLTDEQTAILGCAVALFAAFMVMSLSARLGSREDNVRTTVGRSTSENRKPSHAGDERRRAA